MKKTISITVDADTYLSAKDKLTNISSFLNECLINVIKETEEKSEKKDTLKEIEEIKKQIEELHIKKSIKESVIKKYDEEQTKKIEEQKELEQYSRWLCPVCKHKNFMDYVRCSSCNLPTRNDAKTKIINLKDEGDSNGSTN